MYSRGNVGSWQEHNLGSGLGLSWDGCFRCESMLCHLTVSTAAQPTPSQDQLSSKGKSQNPRATLTNDAKKLHKPLHNKKTQTNQLQSCPHASLATCLPFNCQPYNFPAQTEIGRPTQPTKTKSKPIRQANNQHQPT